MKIKENTFLDQENHKKLTEQANETGHSKSSIINEAVKVYYGMSIDERIERVKNRNMELRGELNKPSNFDIIRSTVKQIQESYYNPSVVEFTENGNKVTVSVERFK